MGKTYRAAGSKSPRTRSKASRLLDDPVASERALKEQLSASRLYAAAIAGDGNCLFRALSDQVYGHSNQHLELRREVCDYLAANADQYSAFVETPFAEHIDTMRKSGTYGGNLELTAAAKMLNRFIKVIQPELVYTISPLDESPAAKAQREKDALARARKSSRPIDPPPDPIYLIYYSWEHYSSVRKLGGPHSGLPELGDIHFGEGGTATNPPPPVAGASDSPDGAQSRKAARLNKRAAALSAAVAADHSASSDTDPGPSTSRPVRSRPREQERDVLAALPEPHPPLALIRDLLKHHHGDVHTVVHQLQADPGLGISPSSSPTGDSQLSLTPTTLAARKRAGSIKSAEPTTRPRRARQITLEDASARAIEERGSSSPTSEGTGGSSEDGLELDDEEDEEEPAVAVDDGPARHTRSSAAAAAKAEPPPGLSAREKREAQRVRKHQARCARPPRVLR